MRGAADDSAKTHGTVCIAYGAFTLLLALFSHLVKLRKMLRSCKENKFVFVRAVANIFVVAATVLERPCFERGRIRRVFDFEGVADTFMA